MPITYIPIASQTLTSSAGSVSFSSIPQTYTDLHLLFTARDASATSKIAFLGVRMNSVTTFYTRVILNSWPGTGVFSSASSTQDAWNTIAYNASDTVANSFGVGELYIPDYTRARAKVASGSSTTEDNTTADGRFYLGAYTQDATAAITSLTVLAQSSFAAGSSFHLYGIKNT